MFCPKCGYALVLKHLESGGDELHCARGDMSLSPAMRQTFEERYGPHTAQQPANPSFDQRFHRGLHWFCPGDGEHLNAQLECTKCGKHLRDLAYQLIEFHPHKAGT